STDMASWRSCDDALACYMRNSSWDGIGIVLGDIGNGWYLSGLDRSFHYLAEQAAEKTRVTLRNPSLM
ncbi:MAG: hypothetical protein WBL84_13210, partial [Xanthobacteraceae bacterium]